MKKFFGLVLCAALASFAVACTTGDYPGDEGLAGNAGSAGTSGTAGSNQLPPGGGSGGSAPAETCGYGKGCYGSSTCDVDGTKCCGNKWSDPASAVCNPNQGGSGGSAPACGFGKQCSGNGTCNVDGSKCCGGVYRDPSSTACTGNGQGGSGSTPTCGFGMVCSGSVSCSVDGTMCCGGVYRDPSSSACNPNQGTGATGGSSGAPACGIGKSCSGLANGVTCPVDGARCCNGTYVDKKSPSCGFSNEGGTATGVCKIHVKLMSGVNAVHVFVQGAGVVTTPFTSLEGLAGGVGPVAYIPSNPPVEWKSLGNCNAELAKGQSLDLYCTATRASICGSAADCDLAFQAYAVMANGDYSYGCNTNASQKGPQVFAVVEADCGDGNTVFALNGAEASGKTVPKYSNFDTDSQVCVE